jgi:hypothetical protein
MTKNRTVSSKAAQRATMQPTVYTFNFKDVPKEKYAEQLHVLFNDPDFCEVVEKRNRMVKAANRMRSGSNEFVNLIRTIQQHDHKLADMLFAYIVHVNLRSDVTLDFLSFTTLLKYYVDYSQEGMKTKVDRLAGNLDRITFLADMLESVLVDVKSGMREIFGNAVEFQQFDAVQQVLSQLRGFFNASRNKDSASADAQLYMDYSDSINDYLEKRLKTYTDKYRKRHPVPKVYGKEDYIRAVKQYFKADHLFGDGIIGRTSSGGIYIDCVALMSNLIPEQSKKLDAAVDGTKFSDMQTYSFAITDAIMSAYQPQ